MDEAPGPVLALDLGERRIGVALSDRRRIHALPHTVLVRSGDPVADRTAICGLVADTGTTLVVVGLPLQLSGAKGPAASAALAEVEALQAMLEIPVVAHDERLTTVEALRRVSDVRRPANRRAGGRQRAAVAKRAIVDDKAAAILLESYLAENGPR